jgi:(p)ppGpp synthase/HD superfamily hydrolase
VAAEAFDHRGTNPDAYANVGRERFLDRVSRGMSLDDVEQVEAAYAFAKGAHRGQYRDDGSTRYFEHCKSVAWICIDELGIADDWQTIAIALLHDTREDSFLLSRRRVELNFGILVRQCIEDLTKRSGEHHPAYIDRLLQPGVDWRALVVKLADRLHNLRTLNAVTPEKRDRKLAETRELYVARLERFYDLVPTIRLSELRRLGGLVAEESASDRRRQLPPEPESVGEELSPTTGAATSD